jgi:hypothetical protein
VPRSHVWATDIDVLPVDRVLERRDRYLVVRSPSNPAHYWGNLLVFDEPPASGDAAPWERWFEAEFGSEPGVHCTFAWDRMDGKFGRAEEEFVSRGYELEETVGLVATPDSVRSHQRENREVTVRTLDPLPAADRELWDQVLELQVTRATSVSKNRCTGASPATALKTCGRCSARGAGRGSSPSTRAGGSGELRGRRRWHPRPVSSGRHC